MLHNPESYWDLVSITTREAEGTQFEGYFLNMPRQVDNDWTPNSKWSARISE